MMVSLYMDHPTQRPEKTERSKKLEVSKIPTVWCMSEVMTMVMSTDIASEARVSFKHIYYSSLNIVRNPPI